MFKRNWMKNLKLIFLLFTCVNRNFHGAKSTQIDTSIDMDSEDDDVKYILLWQAGGTLKNMFGEGQEIFRQNDCPIDNCFVTSNRNMFEGDFKKFDAILFDGSDQNWYAKSDLPNKRYSHQKYAYIQRESAAKAYVCHTGFDNFFNWTITYKLDSDIIFPHMHVRDMNGYIIGPKKDMQWIIETPGDADTDIVENKTKAAAWFYSDCEHMNTHREFVNGLQKAMNKYGLNIDVYGKCGPLHCLMHECDQMLEKDYYFYLALEDYFAEDYVTGNVLRALSNNVVPIVYGGARYDRFLPPKSYLDGTLQTPEALAAIMNTLMRNHTLYMRYFWWKSQYTFSLGQATSSMPLEGLTYYGPTICGLCQDLHDLNKFDVKTVYRNFRQWWYPDYVRKCDIKEAEDFIPNMSNRRGNNNQRIKKLTKRTKEIDIVETEQIRNGIEKLKTDKNKELENEVINEALDNTNRSPLKMEEGDLRRQPYVIQRRAMALDVVMKMAKIMAFSVAFSMFSGALSGFLGSFGEGGGGGGVVRNGGQVANEFARLRASIFVNNFDIYKR